MAFPGTTTGLVLACNESSGGFFNFAAEPLISRVLGGEIETFYWTTLGLAIALLFRDRHSFVPCVPRTRNTYADPCCSW